MTDDDNQIKVKLLKYMIRKKVIGGRKRQIDTVVNESGLETSDHGRARQLLQEMATDPEAPVEQYGGGARENVRLSNMGAARDYADDLGGDAQWW